MAVADSCVMSCLVGIVKSSVAPNIRVEVVKVVEAEQIARAAAVNSTLS